MTCFVTKLICQFLQAMALSTPVIVRNIPANTAIVTDGQTGFVYDTPEVNSLSPCSFLNKV